MQKKVLEEKRQIIISYSLEHLPKTDKVRFFYALKGRNGKNGLILKNNIEQLGRAVLLVPSQNSKETIKFLESWGCNFHKKEVLLIR
ncbi:hypothetical protein J4440_04915 [Candidatus Woesearchaeota archaeon]|nr:hypothetical protein [Candidatus Woesearchaeota archaeon]